LYGNPCTKVCKDTDDVAKHGALEITNLSEDELDAKINSAMLAINGR